MLEALDHSAYRNNRRRTLTIDDTCMRDLALYSTHDLNLFNFSFYLLLLQRHVWLGYWRIAYLMLVALLLKRQPNISTSPPHCSPMEKDDGGPGMEPGNSIATLHMSWLIHEQATKMRDNKYPPNSAQDLGPLLRFSKWPMKIVMDVGGMQNGAFHLKANVYFDLCHTLHIQWILQSLLFGRFCNRCGRYALNIFLLKTLFW